MTDAPSLVRIVGEVTLAMLLILIGLLSVMAYNLFGLVGVPVGAWLLVRPRSYVGLVAGAFTSIELCLWLALVVVPGWRSLDQTILVISVVAAVVSALMAVGAVRLLRLNGRTDQEIRD